MSSSSDAAAAVLAGRAADPEAGQLLLMRTGRGRPPGPTLCWPAAGLRSGTGRTSSRVHSTEDRQTTDSTGAWAKCVGSAGSAGCHSWPVVALAAGTGWMGSRQSLRRTRPSGEGDDRPKGQEVSSRTSHTRTTSQSHKARSYSQESHQLLLVHDGQPSLLGRRTRRERRKTEETDPWARSTLGGSARSGRVAPDDRPSRAIATRFSTHWVRHHDLKVERYPDPDPPPTQIGSDLVHLHRSLRWESPSSPLRRRVTLCCSSWTSLRCPGEGSPIGTLSSPSVRAGRLGAAASSKRKVTARRVRSAQISRSWPF